MISSIKTNSSVQCIFTEITKTASLYELAPSSGFSATDCKTEFMVCEMLNMNRFHSGNA